MAKDNGKTDEDKEPLDEESEIPWDEELAAWAEDETFQGTELRITVFKQEKRGGPKEKIWEYLDEIVTSHELGLRFGGGRYSLYGRIIQDGKTVKMFRRVVALGSSYTEAMNEAKRAALPQTMQGAGYPQTINPINWIEIIKQAAPALAILRDLLRPPNQVEASLETQRIIGRVVEESAKSQIKLLETVRKDGIGQTMGKPEEGEIEDPKLLDEVKDYLKDAIREYGPSLLEAVGLKLRGAMKVIKQDDVFQSLSENPRLLAKVYAKLSEGQTEEEKTLTAKVLKKLSENGMGFHLPQVTEQVKT